MRDINIYSVYLLCVCCVPVCVSISLSLFLSFYTSFPRIFSLTTNNQQPTNDIPTTNDNPISGTCAPPSGGVTRVGRDLHCPFTPYKATSTDLSNMPCGCVHLLRSVQNSEEQKVENAGHTKRRQ